MANKNEKVTIKQIKNHSKKRSSEVLQLLEEFFELNSTEVRILKSLNSSLDDNRRDKSRSNSKEITKINSNQKIKRADELAQDIKRDRTVVQRCLKKLMKNNIVERISECCKPTGGRYFLYKTKSIKELTELIKRENEKRYKDTMRRIKEIDEKMRSD